jgi:hypothetical protein
MKRCRKNHEYDKKLKQCPVCERQRESQYRLDNIEELRQYRAQWQRDNANRVQQYQRYNVDKIKQRNAQYYKDHIDKIKIRNAQWHKTEKLSNPLFKLRGNLSSLIHNSIKNRKYKKSSRTAQLLGTSFEIVQTHLINTAIKNYSSYDPNFKYHIDHIVPCTSAKTEEELIKLQHYANLQYLTPEDNLKKSDSWDGTVENEGWKYEC